MNEIRRGETNSVVLAGMCTALAVVLSVAGFYLPLVSSIIFLLIPLPIAYLGMKEGASWAVIVYTMKEILEDEEKKANKKKELEDILQQYKEAITLYEERIAEMTRCIDE